MVPETLKICLPFLFLMFSNVSGANEVSPPGMIRMFCVANVYADPQALQNGLDWACGPGSANCSAIQPGQPCYIPDNLPSLASYAYNDYYHRAQASGGTCDFGNTAITTHDDPSHGACVYEGSLRSSTDPESGLKPNPGSNVSIGPSMSTDGASARQLLEFTYLIPVILLLWS